MFFPSCEYAGEFLYMQFLIFILEQKSNVNGISRTIQNTQTI